MIKIVRTGEDRSKDYMFDKTDYSLIKKYDKDNENLVLSVKMEDGSRISVKNDLIFRQYGGSLYFDYLGDRYLIDDGYQNVLIKCGYIVLDDYNTRYCKDKDEGGKMRDRLYTSIMKAIRTVLEKYLYVTGEIPEFETITVEGDNKFAFKKGKYQFTIAINTVNGIVSKNQERKMNNLPFYPFDKTMDKYGTIYIAIFCKKLGDSKVLKYKVAENFISDVIKELNDSNPKHEYHYASVATKHVLNSRE